MNSPLESTISDPNSIRIKRIKAGSLFGFIVTTTFAGIFVFSLFCGTLALFGASTVRINEQSVTGVTGFLAALMLAPILTLVFSIFLWILIYFGMVIRGFFGPIVIKYHPAGRQIIPPTPEKSWEV